MIRNFLFLFLPGGRKDCQNVENNPALPETVRRQGGFLFPDESITVAGTPTGGEIADENLDADADGDSLIGVLANPLINRFGAFNGFVANIAGDFLSAFQCRGEALAGFADFFSGHIGRGGYERARIFGECAPVIAG
jgi:hypothetical protein